MNLECIKFMCSNCGSGFSKWEGRCPDCGNWNCLEEVNGFSYNQSKKYTEDIEIVSLSGIVKDTELRYNIKIPELNSIFGGGLVIGSVTLIGGSPGIGKSTLLLQICSYLACTGKIIYISGEESVRQVNLRAARLEINSENIYLYSESDIENISSVLLKEKPILAVIDSIQTVSFKDLSSSAGSVIQVRECTYMLQKIAKEANITIILVGHVNKEGSIAGPKVLEHIVDTVLYFEGDSKNSFRVLRVEKNRFGSVNEIVVFDMKNKGLFPVKNPAALLLSDRPKRVSGSCICAIMKGKNPIFIEVQCLVTKSGFGMPRRMCKGLDYNKLVLLIAVLEKRLGYFFQNMDCYLNVVGGFKIETTEADLAVALALVASLKNIEIDENMVVIGEIGLAGEIRGVSNIERTILEAKKLGFTKIMVPYSCIKNFKKSYFGVELIAVKSLNFAVRFLLEGLKEGEN